MRAQIRRSSWIVLGLGVLALAVWTLRPEPLLVEAGLVTRGALRASVSAEGRTRVQDLYTVASPVDGELERVEIQPGTAVSPDTTIARIRPIAARPLDARSQAEANAAVAAAREAVARAEARGAEAEVGVQHADSKLTRTRTLAESGAAPAADLEHEGHALQMAKDGLESARAAVRQARAELVRATAVAGPVSSARDGAVLEVKAPARGQLLRVMRESAGPIAAGTPLVEIGDTEQLEIVADLLSSDAASVRPGASAMISGWGSGPPLPAVVRRVDPAGFTKLSALGLEEQRVRTILDLKGPPPKGLGHDYRVDVAIVVWEGKDVLRASSTALFRSGERWAAFAIRTGRARLIMVDTGPSDEDSTVIENGLSAGESVIVQPSDAIKEGTLVGVLREIRSADR